LLYCLFLSSTVTVVKIMIEQLSLSVRMGVKLRMLILFLLRPSGMASTVFAE
jgi:hypothetical protein